ncbi:MAG: xanthine dehydrogenase family protein molybdopterin-binding subunit [Intrasporangiaceae bacterium]|nr:xanthine dehydrogenase family protein molybdopterin-binding subunit [Intrasporangiaceae bacterium]
MRRLEDRALLTGAARYVDDLVAEGAAHVAFVRSSIAHGMVRTVDDAEAVSMPGVLAVYHAGNDLGLRPLRSLPVIPEMFNRPPFAGETVRFVGDIVAAVVATTRAESIDAAETVVVDIDPLPAVVDGPGALAEGAPVLFPDAGTNVCFTTGFGEDVDPLQGADVVAEVSMVSQRLVGAPMETNGCLMVPGDSMERSLTAWVSHQAPHSIHPVLAGALGLDLDAVRVVCPWVGGGFGPKAAVYVEYLIAAKAALALGRPVKWTPTRSEDMLSLVHGRDQTMTAKLGLDRDGRFVGLDATVVANAGAYPALGAVLPLLTQVMAVGVYDIPKVRFRATSVATNTTTVGAYRGAGRPEAAQLIERVIDVAADQTGTDPVELRRRNFLDPAAFPLTTTTGGQYDSGEYAKALDAALAAAGYDELRSEQARRRAARDPVALGIGVSAYVEVTAPLGLHTEYGAVEVNDDGSATMAVGTSAHGQGHHTSFAMIVNELLGIPLERVTLVSSDTAMVPSGGGTVGSRSLQTAGNAVHAASTEVLAHAKQIAAHLLEANADDIVVGDGGLSVAGVPAPVVSWHELAAASRDSSRLPDGIDPGPLRHEGTFDGGSSTFPFGAHVAVVEVDTETGDVELTRHIAVDDCGRILNPLLVRGQQHGGIAQGVAQALYEWMQYDANGNPLTTTLMDYTVPSAADLPSFEASNTETDSPLNPLGAKGIGESGTIGATPAVHNAVVDALSHLNVSHIDMPCTPQRVWRAIHSGGRMEELNPNL